MSNKKLIIGVAAGVAFLTAAGILLYRKKSKKQRYIDKAENVTENFKSKLSSLQRKAQKEFKNVSDTGEDVTNIAKEKVNEWLSKAGSSLQ